MQMRQETIQEMRADLKQIIEENEVMTNATFQIWRGSGIPGKFERLLHRDYLKAWWCSMPCTKYRQNPPMTWQYDGTAKPVNVVPARLRSMVCHVMCMTRFSELPLEKPVIVEPMKAFPLIKDLVTDVSWNFRVKKKIKKFKPRPPDAADGTWRMAQKGY